MSILPPSHRWEPDEDFPYEDVRWQYRSDHAVPITVEVDSAASNAYGPPIYLALEQGGETIGIWLDLATWDAIHAAGLRACAKRVEMTEDGWT